MLRVRDVMTRNVFSIGADQPLEHAAWSLRVEDVNGAPVRDARGELIGVVSTSDLADPTRITSATTVRDAMTPSVYALDPECTLMEAVKLMVEKDVHRVLVVRPPHQLVGIVSAMDVMRALATGKLELVG